MLAGRQSWWSRCRFRLFVVDLARGFCQSCVDSIVSPFDQLLRMSGEPTPNPSMPHSMGRSDAQTKPMGLVARVLLTILRLYVWFIMAIFGLLLLSFVAALLPARVGENADASGAPVSLPPTASDVSFYAPPPFGPAEACEFSVSEEAFLAWASDRDLSLKPLGSDGLDVPRFLGLVSPGHPESSVHISDGWSNEWQFEDQRRVWAFDRKTGRAYFYEQTR